MKEIQGCRCPPTPTNAGEIPLLKFVSVRHATMLRGLSHSPDILPPLLLSRHLLVN